MNGCALAEAGIGGVSPELRVVIEDLAARSDELTAKIYTAMNASIGDYSGLQVPDSHRDVQASVHLNVDIWYRALLSGTPPQAADLEQLAEFGRHRVSQGVSLSGLLSAYRLGSRVIWEELLDTARVHPHIERELLVKVSPYILFHFDLLGQTISQAYTREMQQLTRWRDRARHDLASVIFRSPDDLEAFREQVLALGLDGSAPHIAVAMSLTPVEHELQPRYPDLERALEALCAEVQLKPDEFLYFRRHDRLLAWLPLQTGETTIQGERRMYLAAMGAGYRVGCKVGCGLPQTGPAGWRRSADQAMQAIELGARLEPDQSAFRYLDICQQDAILTDEGTTRFLQAWVDRLSSETHLLQTLQAYFDRRGYRKRIAADLNIHPNTLSYRLDRIAQLLEIELDDPSVQALLHTALRLRQLGQD